MVPRTWVHVLLPIETHLLMMYGVALNVRSSLLLVLLLVLLVVVVLVVLVVVLVVVLSL